MNGQQTGVFIFAINSATKENDLNIIREVLPTANIIECLGVSEGSEPEWSYLVEDIYFWEVMKLAFDNGQESVLFLDNERFAHKVTNFVPDGVVYEPLGKWVECSMESALKQSGWTKRLDTEKYYSIF